jgi:hypothetical protein
MWVEIMYHLGHCPNPLQGMFLVVVVMVVQVAPQMPRLGLHS